MNERSSIMKPVAVIDAVRTPFAKSFGVLANVSAVELGETAVRAVLERSGVAPDAIDEVIIGNVSPPADAANPARVIALKAGIPESKIAHTVNRNCASGMQSIISGIHSITLGQAEVVIAGGTESMSNIPLLVRRDAARLWTRLAKSKTLPQKISVLREFRPRHLKPVAGLRLGLTDPVSGLNMGETAEVLAQEFAITRDQQDEYAMESHKRAAETQARCFFSGEIVPVVGTDGRSLDKDDGIRPETSMESLSRLRPIFSKDGTVTPGNSCQLTDGAAAMVLMPSDIAEQRDLEPLGYITGYAIAGCDPRRMGLGPVYATAKLLSQSGQQLTDFDLIEINEAFAAQVIACQRAFSSHDFARRELGWDHAVGNLPMDRVNIHGGAIALGHPVGTTGTRIVLTLLRALREQGKQLGLATLCVGGGQGVAIRVETNLNANHKVLL